MLGRLCALGVIPGSWLCSLTSESTWFPSWGKKLTLVPFIPRNWSVNEEVLETGGVTYIKAVPGSGSRAVVMCGLGAGSRPDSCPPHSLSWPVLLGRALAQWFPSTALAPGSWF